MIHVNVQKQLGDFALDVAFDAPLGVTAIFGRSGSGKTTLIKMIAGLIKPDQGEIRLSDHVLFDGNCNLPPHRRKLGTVFQDARLFPHLDVAQNLTFGGAHEHDKIVDLLGLGALMSRKPADLSGGEKQRVALGRALMSNPDMLLLDEPLAALDAPRKAEILPYLERLRDDFGLPMIYVSHAMSEVARLANTLVVLEAGKVLRAGPLAEVLAHPASVGLFGPRDAGAVFGATVAGYDVDDHLTHLTFDGGQISLPGHVGQVGQSQRVRIPAHDVILANARPAHISARNVLPVTITAIEVGSGPGVVIGLMAGQTPILARITQASLRDMGLSIGVDIFAIIKATAVTPEDAGR